MRNIAEREHRLAVAAVGGELVPFRGLGIVLRHAEPAGIKLAEERHRLRVFLGSTRLVAIREGGEIMAALKGAIGEVGLGGAGRADGRAELSVTVEERGRRARWPLVAAEAGTPEASSRRRSPPPDQDRVRE